MNAFDYFFEKTHYLQKKAVLGRNEEIKFNELFNYSYSLANLIKLRWGEHNNIILISHNSVFFIMVYLGIIKSGNICVPLNPEIEQKNLDFIINTCKSKLVFISEKLKKRFSIDVDEIFNEDQLKKLQLINTDRWISQNFRKSRMAEIIFTSGSTGEPKGVMITHGNIIANSDSIIDYLGLTGNDIIEVVMPFYYCYGLSLLHTHLRAGGGLVLNNTFMLIGSVINDLLVYKCTGFAGVPSHFQILMRKAKSFKTTAFPDLKYVTQAGGKLHDILIKEFINNFPMVKFFVMYGQTEATARLSYLPPEKLREKTGSIGIAIPQVTLDIFDSSDNPIRQSGKVGEIVARGENIMLGYINDEESTKKTLRNGWLYTGDLAYKDNDGYLYLTARKKEIFKIRGIRISPYEIEEVLITMPAVVDCKVESVYDELTGEAIKAILIVNNLKKGSLTLEEVQKYCYKYLPAYKIPQILELREQFNISATGKRIKK